MNCIWCAKPFTNKALANHYDNVHKGEAMKLLHHLGICPKARRGFRCHGFNDYGECGTRKLIIRRN